MIEIEREREKKRERKRERKKEREREIKREIGRRKDHRFIHQHAPRLLYKEYLQASLIPRYRWLVGCFCFYEAISGETGR